MSKGLIFDIKELTVHDGPGVRITVFFKGCPLRCLWCHNPEGLSIYQQSMKDSSGKSRTCGQVIEAFELAAKLHKNAEMLQYLNGGVTISGGEPLMQPEFLLDVLKELHPLHRVLQTSGYGDEATFMQAIESCDLVHFDLKLMSPELHIKYTGKDNALILRNLEHLKALGRNFVIRLVMIDGVNTDEIHANMVADLLVSVKKLVNLELLPYNPFAPAKYPMVDMEYQFIPLKHEHIYPTHIYQQAGLTYRVL